MKRINRLARIMLVCLSFQTIAQDDNGKVLVATGEVFSTENQTIGPPKVDRMWQYKIDFLVKENKPVKTGELIVRFDTQDLRNTLVEKQSALSAAVKQAEQDDLMLDEKLRSARLSLAEAKMNFDKEKRRSEIVDVAASKVDRMKQAKQYEIAKLQLSQAEQILAHHSKSAVLNKEVNQSKVNKLQVDVDKLNADIARLSVKAPKDGIVMYVTDHKGEKLAVGETIWMGRSVLTLPSLDKLAIKAQFDESEFSKVKVNQSVKLTLDAYPELPLTGRITSLGKTFKPKSNRNPKIVFDVFIELNESQNNQLRPGMPTKVELVVEQSS